MHRLKVGDRITKAPCKETFTVIQLMPGPDDYLVSSGGMVYSWHYPSILKGLIVNGGGEVVGNKSAVERKIAFMYSRWEKRHG